VALLNSLWAVVGLIPSLVFLIVDLATGAGRDLEPDHIGYQGGFIYDLESDKRIGGYPEKRPSKHATARFRRLNKEEIEDYIEDLKSPDVSVRKDAVRGLKLFGAGAMKALPELARLRDEDPNAAVRRLAKHTISIIQEAQREQGCGKNERE